MAKNLPPPPPPLPPNTTIQQSNTGKLDSSPKDLTTLKPAPLKPSKFKKGKLAVKKAFKKVSKFAKKVFKKSSNNTNASLTTTPPESLTQQTQNSSNSLKRPNRMAPPPPPPLPPSNIPIQKKNTRTLNSSTEEPLRTSTPTSPKGVNVNESPLFRKQASKNASNDEASSLTTTPPPSPKSSTQQTQNSSNIPAEQGNEIRATNRMAPPPPPPLPPILNKPDDSLKISSIKKSSSDSKQTNSHANEDLLKELKTKLSKRNASPSLETKDKNISISSTIIPSGPPKPPVPNKPSGLKPTR